MGNKIDIPKIKNIIYELSHKSKSNVTEDFLFKTKFLNLVSITGLDLKLINELDKILSDILHNLSDELLLNLADNFIEFTFQSKEDIKYILFCLEFLKLILNSIIKKKKNFRESILFSLNKNKFNQEKPSENKNLCINENIFPVNLINLCINLMCDDIFEKSKIFNYYSYKIKVF